MVMKVILLVTCFVGLTLGDSAPAFIWGAKSNPRPSLETLSQDDFADLLEPNLKGSMIVAFLEPELSSGDFACNKGNSEESCYAYLKGVNPKTYLSSVRNPTEALRQISANREFATIDASGNLENEISYEPGKVVFVSFEVPLLIDDREELLQFHDNAIAKVYSELSQKGPVTGVYTRTQSMDIVRTRRRRAATNVGAPKGYTFRDANNFLIYFSNITNVNGKGGIQIESMTLGSKSDSSFSVTLTGQGSTINFNIQLSQGYFAMSNLVVNEEKYYVPTTVQAPTNFSYFCGNQVFLSLSATKSLVIDSLQMQAPFNERFPKDFGFSYPWYCEGFVTPVILSGLFVVAIMIIILYFGITWMMDINTMDRFDDPKGKTITVNILD